PSASWTWTSRISLAIAGLWSLMLVSTRPLYASLPFATVESASAFAVALAWAAALYAARKDDDEASVVTARMGLGVFGFLWGHQELVHAVSPAASSLLLMGYYAVASVGFVGWGRARRSARLRRAGLGLGVIAALLAARTAWHLPGVPVLDAQLPGVARNILALEQPLLLLLVRDVEEELEHDAPRRGEGALEPVDQVVPLLPDRRRDELLHSRDQHVFVVRAVED